jgi:hypothetical protein
MTLVGGIFYLSYFLTSSRMAENNTTRSWQSACQASTIVTNNVRRVIHAVFNPLFLAAGFALVAIGRHKCFPQYIYWLVMALSFACRA